MNTDSNYQINSTSSASTEKIAALVGKNLRGGEVIELISDLGGGKTVFTKGLAKGAGSQDEATSPTFTISKVYHCPKFDIHHFDFYRLTDPGIVKQGLQEVINDSGVVTVIEWADIVADVLPEKRMTVKLTDGGDDNRILTIKCATQINYLLKGLNRC